MEVDREAAVRKNHENHVVRPVKRGKTHLFVDSSRSKSISEDLPVGHVDVALVSVVLVVPVAILQP